MDVAPVRWIGETVSAFLSFLSTEARAIRHQSRQKKRLRMMLADQRFPKGFRSTEQLMAGIGGDRETTERVLLAMGARRSETSDEWTLKPMPHTAEP